MKTTLSLVTEVLPNIYSIEVPLPYSPLRAVNSYVIKAPGRFLVIDTGWKRKECRRAILQGLKDLNVVLSRTDFFITHVHADHLSLVDELATDRSTVYFNAPEVAIVNKPRPEAEKRWRRFAAVYRSHGFPRDELARATPWHPRQLYGLRGSFSYHILKEGDFLDIGDYSFSCIETPGHSPGHICLYEPRQKMLVSGDHVLDTITPNIAYWPELDNPLKEYLASLDKVSRLDVDIVLPAHRNIFYDLAGRVAELKRHHANRLNEILTGLGGREKNAYQVAPSIKWDIDYPSWELFPPTQKWFAVGETITHLEYLEAYYKIRRGKNKQEVIFSLA